ncbi:hypothetical protein [Myxococcus sp. NMCA1]|uniref:hypothetical protein n=1 Tax=Myxococcus sp. NMCA1 TaxID=2996785 RepID=UPI0022862182|nr:hypothetical protein [Myxococcus sp. NMCA1]WAM28802.1 hypothetical protein OZ403_12065 [Myxococcus sp. NMCA1]
MKHALAALLAAVSLAVLGCGSTEALDAEELPPPEDAVSQMAVCTAQCAYGPAVSCSGTSCSSTDNHGVTCDGMFTACPPVPNNCPGNLPACDDIEGATCPRSGIETQCCRVDSITTCACFGISTSPRRWLCLN